jgi:ABC-type thiamine transport system ATPase subunit
VLSAHAAFEPGLHVVVGSDGAALDTVSGLACGDLAPRRGQILIGSLSPRAVPRARRAVAALRAFEALPPGRSVEAALELLLAARGLSLKPRELLERAGCADWATRRPEELLPAESRRLFLGLALSDTQARVLCLYEPLAAGIPQRTVLSELRARAESAVVLSLTSSLMDARALGGTWYVLDGGVLSPSPGTLGDGAPSRTLLIRSPGARALATLLSADPNVTAVDWDERSSDRELRVSGADPTLLARSIARVARAENISIEALLPALPSLEAVLADRAGRLQGAYENAYRQAQATSGPVMTPGSTQPIYAPRPDAYQSPHVAPPDQSVRLEAPPETTEPPKS